MRWTPLIGLLVCVPAVALQLELSRPELCELSTHVVLGEVTDVETRWTRDGLVERTAHLAVSRVVKGHAVDGLDIHLPGGTIGDFTVRVEDVPNLLTNGEYLLFLGADPGGELVVFGGDQGAVRITPANSLKGETRAAALSSVEVCR